MAVRWVNVKAEHTISWSIRPDKKSINFGIFKHPGSDGAPTPKLPSSTFEPPPTPGLRPADGAVQESHSSRNASSTATEKLKSIGLKPVSCSSTLSYYQNRHTQAVRGSVPLSLAAIGANAKTRQISIDSGAEIWHLKAANQKDFDAWKEALEIAKEQDVHERCMSLLRDLDSIVADFGLIIEENKQRRTPAIPAATSRYSIDTQGSDEFFDAEGTNESQLFNINHESDDEGVGEGPGFCSDADFASASEVDEPSDHKIDNSRSTPAFPAQAKSLTPLPTEQVKRRHIVPAPTIAPPSLIGVLKKNVGKDLSTISMPVSLNEPISLLQRISETFEYSGLLDEAATESGSSLERLTYITTFAISSLSSSRVKDRSIRKPFNPMLGETFELVREDRGFRFIAEKVSHRPVRMACQAESENWTLTQSPLPTQKFWGKSAELITEGKFRVTLHSTRDRFSWTPATCFLRNLIAGEKYVEPVGTMTVVNEVTGEKAIVTFKVKGMFSGRSEDIGVETFDSYGDQQPLGLIGKWTSSLTVTEHGQPRSNEIWTAADLVPDAQKRYGFTTFASSLNEITAIEKGKLPPTDSRLRPDQRAAEEGDLNSAESMKAKLEEAQRKRRKNMEEEGIAWTPNWFDKIDGADGGEEVWVAKRGPDSYWEERKQGQWTGVEKIFDVDAS
ncbi:oxysterol-binding protein-related protein 3/6/7, partial [Lecanoromycetidae sp. Uapishka_2]